MTNNNPKLNSIRSVMNDPKLIKIIKEGLESPVGSTKRKKAKAVLSVSNKIRNNFYGGQGGVGFGPQSSATANMSLLQPAGVANQLNSTYNPQQPATYNPQQSAAPSVAKPGQAAPNLSVQSAPNSNQAISVQQPAKRDIVIGIPLPSTNAATILAPTAPAPQATGAEQDIVPPYGSTAQGLSRWKEESPEDFNKFYGTINNIATPLSDYERPPEVPSAMWDAVNSAIENKIGKETWTMQALPKLKEWFKGEVPEEELPVGALWTDDLPSIRKRLQEEAGLDNKLSTLQNIQSEGLTIGDDLQSYIRGRDNYITNINQMIDKANDMYVTQDVSDPVVRKLLDKYRSYLYVSKGRQSMKYDQYIKTSVKEFDAKLKRLTDEYNSAYDAFKTAFSEEKEITKERYSWYKGMLSDLYENLSEREKDMDDKTKEQEEELANNYEIIKDSLEASMGADGYFNTDTYKELRNASKDKTSFDKNFSYKLNPNDPTAQAFLKGEETTINATEREIIGKINIGKKNNRTIEQIENIILAAGYKPEDFKQHYAGYTPDIIKGIEFMKNYVDDKGVGYTVEEIENYIKSAGGVPKDYEKYYKSWIKRIF